MASRSLNKATLIGNLTNEPEVKYLPQGSTVCTFGLATNRSWTTDAGEKREETEYHRIVAWGKLAELCGQLLAKGRKVYIEGRLQTREWQTADGQTRRTTEIVAEDMIILDSRKNGTGGGGSYDDMQDDVLPAPNESSRSKSNNEEKDKINIDDIPF